MAVDDQSLSDEEDLCPLCAENMDASDKAFLPCPCGYQICQFCYNNIRQNTDLNGRCPACRRKYDDESVRYIVLPADQLKAANARKAVKDRRHKDKKEHEATRKHLAGMRVIQKTLVYVVGLQPPVPFDELQATLRLDHYFGQYGKVSKLVVNKRNQNANSVGNSGYGIYVTYLKKSEADRCILAIDGSTIDGRVVRAAHGTTKYCSLYLKGQSCPNPYCMYLHEPGEEADSLPKQESLSPDKPRGGIIRYTLPKSETEEALLPSTASWAKPPDSAGSNSSAAATVKLPNENDFPTLAESTLQKAIEKPSHKKAVFGEPFEYKSVSVNSFQHTFEHVKFKPRKLEIQARFSCPLENFVPLFGYVDFSGPSQHAEDPQESIEIATQLLKNRTSFTPFESRPPSSDEWKTRSEHSVVG